MPNLVWLDLEDAMGAICRAIARAGRNRPLWAAAHYALSHRTNTLRSGGSVGVSSFGGDEQNDTRHAEGAGDVPWP